MTVLELSDVTIARGGRAVVRGVDLRIPAGSITTLLGANGAGKSTVVLGVAGVIPLVGGSVRADGLEIGGRSPTRVRAAGVATVPEGHRVFGSLTVGENLRAAGSRLSARELSRALAGAYEMFPELGERDGQRAGTLSGGQQQMLAIAGALVDLPRYLLIDELSLGLAPVVLRRLEPVVREIAERGVGVLLIEQFATLALELAEQAFVIDRGEVTFAGSADGLAADPSLLHSAYLAADGSTEGASR